MSKHVVVVGAGVIGLATAYYCVRRGDRVTVVERLPQARDGCSYGNAGMVVPSHFISLSSPGMVAMGLKWMWNPESPFYIKPRLSWDLLSWGVRFWRSATAEHVARSAPLLRDLNLAGRACYEELADETGNEFGLVRRGLVMLCKTKHKLDDEARMAERARSLGMPAEVLDAKAVAELDPGIRSDVAGAVFFPQDCHLSPNRLMAMFERRLAADGATLYWNRSVTGWRTSDGRVRAVATNAGDIEGDEFVVCGGAWSDMIARDLRMRLPMQAGKGYSLTLDNPREMPNVCTILTEARIAVTPLGTSLRFGGTMEMSGLNERIDARRVQGIIRSVPQYFPEFRETDFANVKPWCGLRPCTPDGLPYLGRPRKYANLVVATGHAMMGLSLGAITGKLVSQLIASEKPAHDLSMLAPDRFS